MSKRKSPIQKPGRSETIVRTPPEFLTAVKRLLRIDAFWIDLAASESNSVASMFYDINVNSLEQEWRVFTRPRWCWLNPPYDDIAPWVKKAAYTPNTNIAVLVPASVGSNWWRDWVHDWAKVYFL